MKWKITNTQTRLSLSSAIILFAGLASSIYIYMTAGNVSDTVLEFEETKKYMHDLELYGGKANVLAVELMKWFKGLWQGESLAYTVACITIFISFGFYLVAYFGSSGLESDDCDEGKRDRVERGNSYS
jgi:hypothetical protein